MNHETQVRKKARTQKIRGMGIPGLAVYAELSTHRRGEMSSGCSVIRVVLGINCQATATGLIENKRRHWIIGSAGIAFRLLMAAKQRNQQTICFKPYEFSSTSINTLHSRRDAE